MITYISVGVDDMAAAERFYQAFLPALGYQLEYYHEELSYSLPLQPGQTVAYPEFYVKRPFNGAPATAGNGTMVAFEAASHAQVRDLHAAALKAGGTNEGDPGFRDAYGPTFYVAYLRDPQGNKIALYCSRAPELSPT